MHLFIKRIIDLLGSVILIIVFAPFFIIIGLLIWLEDKSNPFFLQERIGHRMKAFKIIKFRTMISNAESMGTGVFTNESDTRITKVGHFLRKYSLDELPQVFNVFIGNMSFIGPRPPVTYFPHPIDDYPSNFKPRFEMKPGITGLAQISGRTNLTWPQRFDYDIKYAKDFTIFKDFSILFTTIKKLIVRDDVYPTEEFIKKNHKLNNKSNDNK